MQDDFNYRKFIDLIIRKKGLFAFISLAVMTGSVVFSYIVPKMYEAKSTVFIEKNIISDLIKGIAITPSMDETIKVLSYAITSRTILLKAIDDIDINVKKRTDAEVEALVKTLQRNTSVNVKDRNLFMISYKDKDPRFARDFVNALVRRYIEENVSSKREESYGAIKFLSEQLDVFREKLKESELALNKFKTEKGGIINIDEGRLFDEINKSQQRLYEIQLRRRHLEGLKPVTKRASDPMQTNLMALEKRLEELRVEYTDSYPEVIRTKTDIETLKEQMKNRKGRGNSVVDAQELDKIEAEFQALKMSEDAIKRNIASNQALLNSIPSAKGGLEKLEIEMKNRKAIFDQLMAKHGQSEVSKQMEVQDKTTNFRIVDPAILPVKPISPNRVKIILLGIVAGIASAFGLLFVMDYLDNSVRSMEVLKTLEIPVLAVIPKIRNQEEAVKERRKDVRLYSLAGFYFSIIVAVLISEALNFSVVDRIINQIKSLI